MGEAPREYLEEELKTEPFSQREIEARLHSIRVEEETHGILINVSLDDLVVPPDKDIRILMRPLTRSRSVSPGNPDNCEWLALRAELPITDQRHDHDQPQHKVLAVTQTSRDIKFSVRIPGPGDGLDSARPPLWCELYYDPASDNQILLNRTDLPISLSRVSQQASPGLEYIVNPFNIKALFPGTWRIKLEHTEILDFRILEKRAASLLLPQVSSSESSSGLSDMVNSSGKRSFVEDDDGPLSPEKKLRATGKDREDRVIMFLRPQADPLVLPLPNASNAKDQRLVSNGHPLLSLEKDQTVDIPGGCELDQYQITKREPIASTALSSVYTAEHSQVSDGIITVKVLKTRNRNSAVVKPNENERNVIRQADIWLREFQSQEDLQHDGIVRLYGGDARYLSLYMEHIDAKDLAAKGIWRGTGTDTDYFLGDRSDALRVLRDIAGALNYIHSRGLVHNDIKPANILYSRDRGAVLCDFGLSTYASNPPTTGGTPFYIPPEFIGHRLRGQPSDVWALGVTMLYVTGKITFPDARGVKNHPRQLYWLIAEVNRAPYNPPGASGRAPSAVSQMHRWLLEINEARSKLNKDDKLERLIFEMLIPNPAQRITTRKIFSELFPEQNNKTITITQG